MSSEVQIKHNAFSATPRASSAKERPSAEQKTERPLPRLRPLRKRQKVDHGTVSGVVDTKERGRAKSESVMAVQHALTLPPVFTQKPSLCDKLKHIMGNAYFVRSFSNHRKNEELVAVIRAASHLLHQFFRCREPFTHAWRDMQDPSLKWGSESSLEGQSWAQCTCCGQWSALTSFRKGLTARKAARAKNLLCLRCTVLDKKGIWSKVAELAAAKKEGASQGLTLPPSLEETKNLLLRFVQQKEVNAWGKGDHERVLLSSRLDILLSLSEKNEAAHSWPHMSLSKSDRILGPSKP